MQGFHFANPPFQDERCENRSLLLFEISCFVGKILFCVKVECMIQFSDSCLSLFRNYGDVKNWKS